MNLSRSTAKSMNKREVESARLFKGRTSANIFLVSNRILNVTRDMTRIRIIFGFS